MKNRIIVFLLMVSVFTSNVFPQMAMAKQTEDEFLIAVSLKAVKEALKNGGELEEAARNLAWITTPKSIVIDDNGDLILVGVRDNSSKNLTMDDFAVAFRNIDLLEGDKSPGVSIEPPKDEKGKFKYGGDYLKVIYSGKDVESSNTGRIYYETDILLKLLSMGYEPLGLEGIPTEWDIDLHRTKSGIRLDPWLQDAVNSFFFPTHVKVVSGDGSSYLHSLKISVLSGEKDWFHKNLEKNKIPEDVIEKLEPIDMETIKDISEFSELKNEINGLIPGEESAKKVLRIAKKIWKKAKKDEKKYSNALAPADEYLKDSINPVSEFANILSENFSELEEKHPILKSYRNVTGLLALLQSTKEMNVSPELKKWFSNYNITPVETPTKIPVIHRSVNGLAVRLQTAGGLIIDPLIYRARAGSPNAVKELTIKSRPSNRPLFWLIPIAKDTNPESLPLPPEYEAVNNGSSLGEYFINQGLYKKGIDLMNKSLIEGMLQTNPENKEALELKKYLFLKISLNDEKPKKRLLLDLDKKNWVNPNYYKHPLHTPGWDPSTKGFDLLELTGTFDIGTGSGFSVRQDQLYIDPPKELFSMSYDFSLRYVLNNKIDFGVAFPFQFKYFEVPASSKLPGLVTHKTVSGLSNINLSSRFLLLGGSWEKPSLLFNIFLVTPWYSQFHGKNSKNDDLSKAQRIQFGLDGWSIYMGPSTTIPMGKKISTKIVAYVNPSYITPIEGGEKKKKETSYYLNFEPSIKVCDDGLCSIGVSITRIEKEKNSVQNYEIFFDAVKKTRVSRNSIGVSMYGDNDPFVFYKVSFLLDFLDFRKAKWF